jgi:hypothetical protein
MQNRYADATTTLGSTRATTAAMYSPNQAAFGTFLGGPIGLIYWLYPRSCG